MRKGSGLLIAVLLVTFVPSAGCKKGAEGPDLSTLGPSSAATTTLLPAGSQLCPGGGIGIYSGSDGNNNGILDAAEVQKGEPVCVPVAEEGKPGDLLSLVMIASEPSGTAHCPAGGLKVLSGADGNRNNLLEPAEVLFTEYLCNGAPGASSAAGITVATAPQVSADKKKDKKKDKKQDKKKAPVKKPAAAAEKGTSKAAGDSSATAEEKAVEKARPAAAKKEKSAAAKPAPAQKGWNPVKNGSSALVSASYKVEGKYIIVRFTNNSTTATARCKYSVKWKMNQGGGWVDDSTMEGLTVRLNPGESVDKDIRTQAQDIRDVVVDLTVSEGS